MVGKPSKSFFESALGELGVPPEQVRLRCHDHGLCHVFVPTGAFFLFCYCFEKFQKRLKENASAWQRQKRCPNAWESAWRLEAAG